MIHRFQNMTMLAILLAVLMPVGATDQASITDDEVSLIAPRSAYVPKPIVMNADLFLYASPWDDFSQERHDVLMEAQYIIDEFIQDPTQMRLEQDWRLMESDYGGAISDCVEIDINCKDICYWTEHLPNYDLAIDAGPPAAITTPMVVPYGPNDDGTRFWRTSWGWGGGEITADLNLRCVL